MGNYQHIYFFILHRCSPSSQHHKTDFNQGISRTAYVTRRKAGNRQRGRLKCGETVFYCVSYLQRACSPLPKLLILKIYCCAQDALPTENVGIWHPRTETQHSTFFMVHWWTPLTSPTDSNLRFNSPLSYIYVAWGSVSFAQKWPVTMILLTSVLWVHFRACAF